MMSKTSSSDNLKKEQKLTMEEMTARHKEVAAARRETIMPQHITFVNAYFQSKFDFAVAGEAVGISARTAREWVEQPGPVMTYMKKRLERFAEQSDITLDEIVSLLIKEATREAVPGDKTVSHMARVTSLDTLAKIKGAYDKGKGSGKNIQVNISIGKQGTEMQTITGTVVDDD